MNEKIYNEKKKTKYVLENLRVVGLYKFNATFMETYTSPLLNPVEG